MEFIYIPLGGEALSGKDTAAVILSRLLSNLGYFSIIKPLSDPIKAAIPPTGNKEEDRPKWQAYGNERRIKDGPDVFARELTEFVETHFLNCETNKVIVLIPDLRLPAEFNFFRIFKKSFIIKIDADEEVRRTRMGEVKWKQYKEKSQNDSTETGISSIPRDDFDFILDNNEDNIDILELYLVSLIYEHIDSYIKGEELI